MPTRLILLAHGATGATRRAAFPRDEGLEPDAAAAAGKVGARLPVPDRLLCSPARAAAETAAALAGPGWPACRTDEGLRDLDWGRWAGRAAAEVGEAFGRWMGDPHAVDHGGETVAALCGRVRAWLAAGVDAGDTTLAVTHGTVVRAALLAVLEAPLASYGRTDVAPLAALALGSDGRRWTLRAFGPSGGRPFSASGR